MWRAHIPELLPAPFPEFLQLILAFLIQLIPRSSGLCCSSAQEMVGQSQPAAHGRSHGTAPGTPRSHQGSREPPLSPSAAHISQSTFQGRGDGTAGGGSGCHGFASGRICPRSAGVLFSPRAGGFSGCHSCGSCSRCPRFQRRQFLLLSSHRQGKPGQEGTKQQQNLSFLQ